MSCATSARPFAFGTSRAGNRLSTSSPRPSSTFACTARPRRLTAAATRTAPCAGGAKRIAAWRKGRKDVLVYFDNDEKGYAPVNALRLGELCRKPR